MKKSILDGYLGVKFETLCQEAELPPGAEAFINSFRDNGRRLLAQQMAPANGGNMSTRWGEGFLITASGCNLGVVEECEVIYVETFSLENKLVTYRGTCPPSSETFLHGLLYREKPGISSVLHAHDPVATSMNLGDILLETEREEPYGTVELASLCLDTFRKGSDIIVLKNHGYVAIGSSLDQVTDKIIHMHNHLLGLQERPSPL